MTIVLREVTREAADAILAGERPGDVRVADGYPTEFSVLTRATFDQFRCLGCRDR